MDFVVGRAPTALATAAALCLWPALASAQPEGGPSFGPLLLRTLLTLGMVLLLLVVVLRAAARARIGGPPRSDAGALEVAHRHPVGPRQALLVVRFGDRAVLVGQSAGSLERLAELPWARYVHPGGGFGALLERDANTAASPPAPAGAQGGDDGDSDAARRAGDATEFSA